jgi:hypothetical protein
MKYTIRTTLFVTLSIIAMSLAGCHSGAQADGSGSVTINGEHGKVYSGTAAQVSNQMGQDYGAGLRDMANRQAVARP